MARKDKQEVVTIKVQVIHKSPKALLCVEEDKLMEVDPPEFWLPMSQIEITHIDQKKDIYTIDVPEWLAIKHKLV
jgi:hypothetical protein